MGLGIDFTYKKIELGCFITKFRSKKAPCRTHDFATPAKVNSRLPNQIIFRFLFGRPFSTRYP
jgi:hypothetical protein